jgi:nitrite reductase/ring-hydroxylating ferredoxin subunit/DMSO/TMAO reductase YedYZ heme-binding membrane subunit
VSHAYVAVQWNRQKRIYDACLAAGLALYLALFVGVGALANPGATAETLVIRGLGTAALLLLHVILCIGPLCRLAPVFLPLLYNRRHLGVTMFALALAHASFAVFQFHALGDVNPLVSVLTSNTRFASVPQFPFEAFGLAALAVLFAMAATSHDFWLANLTAPVWKALHMSVYAAYAALVLHVALGALQDETSPLLAGALALGMTAVIGLHVAAALRERAPDRERDADAEGWVDVCAVDAIPEKRARIASVAGERVAVFRYDGRISAISNVCQHQNGPLGEGKIVAGCITCPWHGYQYDPATGASPPPFTERVPTFRARVRAGRVEVHRAPNPPGTRVEPARTEDGLARAV